MDMSSSTTNNRMRDSHPSKTTPPSGMQETSETLKLPRASRPLLPTKPPQIPHARTDEYLLARSLLTPRHVNAHRNFILDRHCQERWRIDFEISEGGRNGPGDMSHVALRFYFEGDLLVLCSLAGELNLQIGIDGR